MRTRHEHGTRWSPREVARFLCTSVAQVYALVDRDELPHTRSGPFLSFEPEVLRAWVRARSGPARVGGTK